MEITMTVPSYSRALVVAFALVFAAPLAAQEPPPVAVPLPVQSQGDVLEELDRKADELSETARRTIEEFVNLVGPMLTRLSHLIEGLPVYETPEILPNGDIIIRRKQEPIDPGTRRDDGLTDT